MRCSSQKLFSFSAIIGCMIFFRIHLCCEATGNTSYAIATMVSSADYTIGANVLQFSLKKFLDPTVLQNVTFVALLIEGKSENKIIESDLGPDWQRRYVTLISPAQDGDVTFHRFKEQFTKLHLWQMIEFNRILYLDCDTLVVGDVSPMLVAVNRNFAAVHDFEQGKIVTTFNMGVASLVPNISEFERLDKLRQSKRDYRLQMGEQGFLNAVYNSDYHEFPFEYSGNLAAAVQNREFWDLHSKQLRVIHYTWIKPFHRRRNSNLEIENCYGDCKKCDDVLKQWWTIYDEMKKVKQLLTLI